MSGRFNAATDLAVKEINSIEDTDRKGSKNVLESSNNNYFLYTVKVIAN